MSRYAAAHIEPQGAGDGRPTALQIIEDEHLLGALKDKVIVITGATSGIGLETAKALHRTGARLVLTVRDIQAAQKGPLTKLTSANNVYLVQMDNSSLKSVREAASEILALAANQINVLIANAGVMGFPDMQHTEDGFEAAFAVNHLSHFLLFQLLKPALLASATPTWPSRIVNVSSSAHRVASLPSSDDYNFENSTYDFGIAYGRSKLAQIYATNEIDRRYGVKHLHAMSLHPGAIRTNISRHLDRGMLDQILANPVVMKSAKSPEQGAATTVLAAVGKEWAHQGGKYLQNCQVAPRGDDDGNAFGTGYVRQTYDSEAEARLWSDSLKMIGLTDDA